MSDHTGEMLRDEFRFMEACGHITEWREVDGDPFARWVVDTGATVTRPMTDATAAAFVHGFHVGMRAGFAVPAHSSNTPMREVQP